MIDIVYAPSFLREFKKLPKPLQQESKDAIKSFVNKKNLKKLHVHKLKGTLAGRYSFSINFHYRIVFQYLSKDSVAFLAIGDHSINS
jgi:addiction module RelE/StbE family toxin